MPTVSVVIPLYNARDLIRHTIQSVLVQTWKDYEIIVIDDGSTDGSGQVVREFGSSLRYVRQENAGVACARNRGIAESNGKYVALLDHDDLWHPTKLEKQVAVLERRPEVGMVITDVVHIGNSGEPIGAVAHGYNPSDRFYQLFVKGYVPTPSAAMLRMLVLETVGGFNEAFHSAGLDDHELWPRIAEVCEIVNIPEPLTLHRSGIMKPPEIALAHRAVLVERLLEKYRNDPERRRHLLRERAFHFADMGKYLVRQGQRREGRSYLIRGLVLSLGEARTLKTAWRCLSRITRSYT